MAKLAFDLNSRRMVNTMCQALPERIVGVGVLYAGIKK
jgi:hypothetical protein